MTIDDNKTVWNSRKYLDGWFTGFPPGTWSAFGSWKREKLFRSNVPRLISQFPIFNLEVKWDKKCNTKRWEKQSVDKKSEKWYQNAGSGQHFASLVVIF